MNWNDFAKDFGGYAIDVGPAIIMFFDLLAAAKLAMLCLDYKVSAERCGLQITISK